MRVEMRNRTCEASKRQADKRMVECLRNEGRGKSKIMKAHGNNGAVYVIRRLISGKVKQEERRGAERVGPGSTCLSRIPDKMKGNY